MIQDLHSHSYYSFCGADDPEALVEAAIEGGIEVFGITDHNHGVINGRYCDLACTCNELPHVAERTLQRYFDHINLIKEKYADKITVKRGIEVSTMPHPRYYLPDDADISYYDYCLLEHVNEDAHITVTHRDIFAYAKRCGCMTGIAHTDMFDFIRVEKADPYEFFCRMAQENIFWEMNVSLDSIHHYYEHPYMLKFFEDKEQQDIVRRSGVRVSIGFDGHRVSEYKPDRIKNYCHRIEDMGIKMPFED